MQLMSKVGAVRVCAVKTRTVRNGFDAKGVENGHTLLGKTIGKWFCVCVTIVRKDRHWFVMAAKCYGKRLL